MIEECQNTQNVIFNYPECYDVGEWNTQFVMINTQNVMIVMRKTSHKNKFGTLNI